MVFLELRWLMLGPMLVFGILLVIVLVFVVRHGLKLGSKRKN